MVTKPAKLRKPASQSHVSKRCLPNAIVCSSQSTGHARLAKPRLPRCSTGVSAATCCTWTISSSVPNSARRNVFAEPGGNVDRERFETEVLAPLAAGQAAQYRPWDCHTGDFAVAYAVEPAQLTIVEGSYSMHPALRRYYDCMICLAVDPAEQLRRLERRNPRMLQRFVDEWIPLENRYFEATNIQAVADLLVDTALPDGGSVVEPV